MARQWNCSSLDCVTTRSTISQVGFPLIHSVMRSPSCSRSRAIVAEKTFTPLNDTYAAFVAAGLMAARRNSRPFAVVL